MTTNVETVTAYLDALARGTDGLGAARALLADDLEYHDPLMAAASADELIERLREVDTGNAPIEVLDMASSGDGVAVLTTFTLPDGRLVHFTQWFWIRDGRIVESRVIYDTGPFLSG